MHLQVLGILHALVLCALSWGAAGRLVRRLELKLGATYLLAWSNLVFTALLLSVFSRLDHAILYACVSLALATGLFQGLRWVRLEQPSEEKLTPELSGGRFGHVAMRVLAATLLLAATASAIICFAYVPNNWDSCTYRLSRPFFYLARGNLLHAGSPMDPRVSIYPFNSALLYLFLAIYRFQAPQWMNIVTFAGWVFAGIAIYAAARTCKASRSGALAAAWFGMMTPNVLGQASSTLDESFAAVPILFGIAFGCEYWKTDRRRYAALAMLGIGLGLGTKLHWVFYWIFLICVAAWLVLRIVRDPSTRTGLQRRLPALAAVSIPALPLAVSFLVCNYASTGKLTDTTYNNTALNVPFSASLAREKVVVNTAELFLSPIMDLVPPVHPEEREAAYREFNRYFMQHWFTGLTQTVKPTPAGYVFRGPANPDGFRFYEYTWAGFLPHLLVLAGIAGLFSKRVPIACTIFAASFFFWHVTIAMQTRYQSAFHYYSFAAVLAAAGLGVAWDYSRASRSVAARILTAAFVAVFATHLVLDANLLGFGSLRNLHFLFRSQPPPDNHPVTTDVVRAIQASDRIYIPGTHWEVLYWNLMRFNPGARYFTGLDFRSPSPDTLSLVNLTRSLGGEDLPVRLPPGLDSGFIYLGEADYNAVLAQGNGVAERYPERVRYTVGRFYWNRNAAGKIASLRSVRCCAGVAGASGVEYRYRLKLSGSAVVSDDWRPSGKDGGPLQPSPAGVPEELAVETRRANDPEHVVTTTYPLGREEFQVPAQ